MAAFRFIGDPRHGGEGPDDITLLGYRFDRLHATEVGDAGVIAKLAGNSKDFKTHYTWLPTGRWGIENIANLDKVPATGATLVAGLTKVKDATGGPARIFALV